MLKLSEIDPKLSEIDQKLSEIDQKKIRNKLSLLEPLWNERVDPKIPIDKRGAELILDDIQEGNRDSPKFKLALLGQQFTIGKVHQYNLGMAIVEVERYRCEFPLTHKLLDTLGIFVDTHPSELVELLSVKEGKRQETLVCRLAWEGDNECMQAYQQLVAKLLNKLIKGKLPVNGLYVLLDTSGNTGLTRNHLINGYSYKRTSEMMKDYVELHIKLLQHSNEPDSMRKLLECKTIWYDRVPGDLIAECGDANAMLAYLNLCELLGKKLKLEYPLSRAETLETIAKHQSLYIHFQVLSRFFLPINNGRIRTTSPYDHFNTTRIIAGISSFEKQDQLEIFESALNPATPLGCFFEYKASRLFARVAQNNVNFMQRKVKELKNEVGINSCEQNVDACSSSQSSGSTEVICSAVGNDQETTDTERVLRRTKQRFIDKSPNNDKYGMTEMTETKENAATFAPPACV